MPDAGCSRGHRTSVGRRSPAWDGRRGGRPAVGPLAAAAAPPRRRRPARSPRSGRGGRARGTRGPGCRGRAASWSPSRTRRHAVGRPARRRARPGRTARRPASRPRRPGGRVRCCRRRRRAAPASSAGQLRQGRPPAEVDAAACRRPRAVSAPLARAAGDQHPVPGGGERRDGLGAALGGPGPRRHRGAGVQHDVAGRRRQRVGGRRRRRDRTASRPSSPGGQRVAGGARRASSARSGSGRSVGRAAPDVPDVEQRAGVVDADRRDPRAPRPARSTQRQGQRRLVERRRAPPPRRRASARDPVGQTPPGPPASTGGGSPSIQGQRQLHDLVHAGQQAGRLGRGRPDEEHDPVGAGRDGAHRRALQQDVAGVVEAGDEDARHGGSPGAPPTAVDGHRQVAARGPARPPRSPRGGSPAVGTSIRTAPGGSARPRRPRRCRRSTTHRGGVDAEGGGGGRAPCRARACGRRSRRRGRAGRPATVSNGPSSSSTRR